MRLPILPVPADAVGWVIATALLAFPATAAAAPPPNDNYLVSTTITGREYRDSIDTTDATTQPDLFNPDKEGKPFAGGGPEPTSCGAGLSYGRTAWWDFRPPRDGALEVRASGGFDVVVAVYTWSQEKSLITRHVLCQNDEVGPELVRIPRVRARRNYTIQVGGANDAGGPLGFRMDYRRDTDGDGVLDDEPDRCRTRSGLERLRGCPPRLRSTPRIAFAPVGTSLRITSLAMDDVPKGARAEVRCARCGRTVTRRARRTGTLRMNGFARRIVPAGDRIEVRVTLGRTGEGRYRHGAVGRYYHWPVEPGTLGRMQARCLQPGSRKPTRCR